MEKKPSAVVVSVAVKNTDDIIKLILEENNLPDPTFLEDGIPAYPWHIDTKYYTADINVCSLTKKTIGSKEFADGVGAVVIYFDSEREDGIKPVESWIPFIKELSPEVQILLCERCNDSSSLGPSRIDIQHWCVDNKFELVELNPEVSSDDEVDEDLPGLAVTTGVRRVVQALHAHLWPNMVMKERSQLMSPAMLSLLNRSLPGAQGIAACIEGLDGDASSDTDHHVLQARVANRIDEMLGLGDSENEDIPDVQEGADFNALLGSLREVRERCSGPEVTNEERLAMAEKAVVDFWHAISGPEEELT